MLFHLVWVLYQTSLYVTVNSSSGHLPPPPGPSPRHKQFFYGKFPSVDTYESDKCPGMGPNTGTPIKQHCSTITRKYLSSLFSMPFGCLPVRLTSHCSFALMPLPRQIAIVYKTVAFGLFFGSIIHSFV